MKSPQGSDQCVAAGNITDRHAYDKTAKCWRARTSGFPALPAAAEFAGPLMP
jgi:hypothetical protein